MTGVVVKKEGLKEEVVENAVRIRIIEEKGIVNKTILEKTILTVNNFYNIHADYC